MNSPEGSPGTPTTPEQHTEVPPIEKVLRLPNVEDFREQTRLIYYTHYHRDPGESKGTVDDPVLLDTELQEAVSVYLRDNGLDESDDNYIKLHGHLRAFAWDRMFARRWRHGDWVDKNDHTKGLKPRTNGPAKLRNVQLIMTGRDLEAEANEQANTPDGPETTVEKLVTAREAKHVAYVDRLKGPLFGKKRKANDEAYRRAEADYTKLLGERLEERIGELRAEGQTDDEIKEFLKEQANTLAAEDEAAQKTLLVEKSGVLGNVLKKYAEASRGKKLAYGLGLGAAAAITGVGAGFVMGVALGAAGGAALAGLAATGSGLAWKGFGAFRTYHLRRAEIFKNDSVPDFEFAEAVTVEGERRRVLDFLHELSSEQLQEGERIKKRAMVFAVGSVAVGTTVGLGVHAALEAGDWSHWGGGLTQHVPDHSSDSGPNLNNPNLGGNGGEVESPDSLEPLPPPEPVPSPSPSRGEIIRDYIAEHGAASRIDRGEGWFQTFKELGITAENRRAFLNEYGDDLLKKFPKVTFRMDNGEPGILMTKDGKMPKEVLEYIVKHADKQGWLKHALDFSEVTPGSGGSANNVLDALPDSDAAVDGNAAGVEIDAPTTEAANRLIESSDLVPANTVSNGESFTRTLNELKKAGVIDIQQADYGKLLKSVGSKLATIKYPDGTPVAYPNRFPPYDWRLNRSPSGRLHATAIRTIEKAARVLTPAKAA